MFIYINICSDVKEVAFMKAKAWIWGTAVLAVLVATPALAAVTVLSENFEGQGWKNKWDFTPPDEWSQQEQGGNHYMAFSGQDGGRAETVRGIRVNDGELYKIQLRYRYGPAEVEWGTYKLGDLSSSASWKEVSFMKATTKQEQLQFEVRVKDTASRFHFDDVLIVRCETAVAPSSLGRVRALFR
jgi:hypothetical protein